MDFNFDIGLKKAPFKKEYMFFSIDDWFYSFPDQTFNAISKKEIERNEQRNIFKKLFP